jgi:hypothetical protein
MDIALSVPIWTIHHVAAALPLKEDTAREYTYTPAFPAARAGFSRNLWLREDVLAWFAGLPAAEAGGLRRRARGTATAAPAPSAPEVAQPSRPRRSYKPRPR